MNPAAHSGTLWTDQQFIAELTKTDCPSDNDRRTEHSEKNAADTRKKMIRELNTM